MLSPYPWGALEPVSRTAHQLASGARRQIGVTGQALAAALSGLLELPCELIVRRCSLSEVPSLAQAVWLSNEGWFIGLEPEPVLAAFLAARVLKRREVLMPPGQPLPPALVGLLAALSLEAARRSGSGTLFSLLETAPCGETAARVDATLIVEGRPFNLRAWLRAERLGPPPPASLSRLGSLKLSLPLVVASLCLDAAELAALEPGAALVPEPGTPGLTLDGFGVGVATLVAPASEHGIQVVLRSDGRLVVGERVEARLTVERETSLQDEAATLTDVVLDAPLVVRIELGAVSMSAREWAGLGPGDIIETSQRVAEPVVLRIAGREVGRGELVNVDGQVGVRIQKLNGDNA